MSNKKTVLKVNADGKISIVTTLLGIYWSFVGFRLGLWDKVSPGPGFLPVFVGVLTIIFSLLLFIQSRNKEVAEMTDEQKKWLIKIPLIALVIVFAMKYLGTIVSLTIFFTYWFKKIARFSWKKTIILTFVIMSVIFLVFDQWLKVPFPKFFGLF